MYVIGTNLIEDLKLCTRLSSANKSAAFACAEAISAADRQDFTAAAYWIEQSMRHSVGVFGYRKEQS